MSERSSTSDARESDPRFPTGPWTGFYLQEGFAGRNWMRLDLTFTSGRFEGFGVDRIGRFLLAGTYSVDDGRCDFKKTYIGRHAVEYTGYNEGKGIWGRWLIPGFNSGGFYIWPEAWADPTTPRLGEEAELPASERRFVVTE